eukprot:scaffold6829_cov171-Amphora_coffeaeformis.AAC.20
MPMNRVETMVVCRMSLVLYTQFVSSPADAGMMARKARRVIQICSTVQQVIVAKRLYGERLFRSHKHEKLRSGTVTHLIVKDKKFECNKGTEEPPPPTETHTTTIKPTSSGLSQKSHCRCCCFVLLLLLL